MEYPVASPNAANCAIGTSNRPMAKVLAIVTPFLGPSLFLRCGSVGGEPMMNSPGCSGTISGQTSQSLKVGRGRGAAAGAIGPFRATPDWPVAGAATTTADRSAGALSETSGPRRYTPPKTAQIATAAPATTICGGVLPASLRFHKLFSWPSKSFSGCRPVFLGSGAPGWLGCEARPAACGDTGAPDSAASR